MCIRDRRDAVALVAQGHIADSKSVTGILLAERRLRGSAPGAT